ncbi:unnamed protein product [Blepharisma stoltei]|uniref:Uncharacterized protein n=1 Tax=Blepharisma stoltei TaxID=1481888 RepID=A0AAU9JBC6_9CILI|nr:unnamed protein product [Blepharisma stoltei]
MSKLIWILLLVLLLALDPSSEETLNSGHNNKALPDSNKPSIDFFLIDWMVRFALFTENWILWLIECIRSHEPYNIVSFYIIFLWIFWKLFRTPKSVSYITHSSKVIDKKTQEAVIKFLDDWNKAIEKELSAIKASIKPNNLSSLNIESSINLVPEINKVLQELKEIENTHKEFEEEINASHKEMLEEIHYLTLETLKPPEPESASLDSYWPEDEEPEDREI